MEAEQKNFDFFGIEHYGECWSGMNADYSVHSRSGRCKMVKKDECAFEACDEKRNDSRLCFGSSWALYVYKIKHKRKQILIPAYPLGKCPEILTLLVTNVLEFPTWEVGALVTSLCVEFWFERSGF